MPDDLIMISKDHYRTIKSKAEGLYKEKGSKFLSYAFQVNSQMEVEQKLEYLKELHPKARHLCYAYRLGVLGEDYRANDDGEPSGSAGKPLMNELLSHELTNIVLCVIRYFGGTKLGVSGLINAYKTSGKDAIENADITTLYLTDKIKLYYPIEKMGLLYNILKKLEIEEIENHHGDDPFMLFALRKSLQSDIMKKIVADYHGYPISDLADDYVSDEITFEIINV